MDEKFEAVLTSPLDGLICVDRMQEKKGMPGERKEATQDMYITELQRENARTKTMFENIEGDIKDLRESQNKVLEIVTSLASDLRAGQVTTDMRFERFEGGLSAAHARLDEHEKKIDCLKSAREKAMAALWKNIAKYGIGGAVMLMLLGIKEWIKQTGV